MPIGADCPECGHAFNLPDKLAGKKVRCTKCEAVFRVPAAEALVVRARGADPRRRLCRENPLSTCQRRPYTRFDRLPRGFFRNRRAICRRYPVLGSFLAKELEPPDAELPSYVSIGPFRFLSPAAFGPGFLGPQYAPLIVG